MDDRYYLNLAYIEALKAYNKDEVPVGCVIVKDGKVISKAHNLRETHKCTLGHAEVIAIYKACKKLKTKFLDDTTIYITLEPCLMCLGAIIQARIKRVVYCANEPKFGCIESLGNLFDNYKFNHKIEVESGIMKEEVSKLMKDFFQEKRKK